jgi:hypothetical protein
VVQGWAGEALLDSYEAERKPIAHRNTTFARSMADSIGRIKVPANIDADDADGTTVRMQLGLALGQHVRNEFNIPGLQLGLRYEGSPIVHAEGTPTPADQPNHYLPSARPGGRAPHFWLEGQSIFDVLCNSAEGCALYGADRVLIRPDHHVAWRGNAQTPAAPVLAMACARAVHTAEQLCAA